MQNKVTFILYYFDVKTGVFREGKNMAEGLGEYGAEEYIWIKREKVTGNWRKLHIQGLKNMSSSTIAIQIIKST
jgi:hypothetical protein